jgi:hypothetical protein
LLAAATAFQTLLLGASVVIAGVSSDPVGSAYRYALIVVLGVAMGIQNATARKLAVPDLTTTVLTLTITGVAADSAIAGRIWVGRGPSARGCRGDVRGRAGRRGARARRSHRCAARDCTGCDGGSRAGQREPVRPNRHGYTPVRRPEAAERFRTDRGEGI